jgi:hypothetical protein
MVRLDRTIAHALVLAEKPRCVDADGPVDPPIESREENDGFAHESWVMRAGISPARAAPVAPFYLRFLPIFAFFAFHLNRRPPGTVRDHSPLPKQKDNAKNAKTRKEGK